VRTVRTMMSEALPQLASLRSQLMRGAVRLKPVLGVVYNSL